MRLGFASCEQRLFSSLTIVILFSNLLPTTKSKEQLVMNHAVTVLTFQEVQRVQDLDAKIVHFQLHVLVGSCMYMKVGKSLGRRSLTKPRGSRSVSQKSVGLFKRIFSF